MVTPCTTREMAPEGEGASGRRPRARERYTPRTCAVSTEQMARVLVGDPGPAGGRRPRRASRPARPPRGGTCRARPASISAARSSSYGLTASDPEKRNTSERARIEDRLGAVAEAQERVEGAGHDPAVSSWSLRWHSLAAPLGGPEPRKTARRKSRDAARRKTSPWSRSPRPASTSARTRAVEGPRIRELAEEQPGEGHGREAPGHGEALVVGLRGQEEDAPWGSGVGCLARRPSGLQVMIRCRTSSSVASARSIAATLSGLSPDRANETSRVGVSGTRHSRGCVTRSVVGTALTQRPMPARQRPLEQLADERRGAGAGEDHAAIPGCQGLLEEGKQDGPLRLEPGQGRPPEIGLAEDLPDRVAGAQRREGVGIELGEDAVHASAPDVACERGAGPR